MMRTQWKWILSAAAVAGVTALVVGPVQRPAARYGDPARPLSGPGAVMPFEAGFASGDWPSSGGDLGGSQSSPLGQITPANIQGLSQVWSHSSGDAVPGTPRTGSRHQTTPIVVDGSLYYCTPSARVFSLDPATGKEKWVFDPRKAGPGGAPLGPGKITPGNCRGVSYWRDSAASKDTLCAARIYRTGSNATIYAMDAVTGRVCSDFGADKGHQGYVTHLDFENHGEGVYPSAVPPLVVGDTLIAGQNTKDGISNAADGIVRGFDARSGKLLWEFNPIPVEWRDKTGAANVWTTMAADPKRGYVFLATTSPSTDFFGGGRKFDIPLANAVVAVRISDGSVAWSYQIVRHDLWDYDLPGTPQAITIRKDGKLIDVVVEQTKMGTVYVLDRDTGKPVFPIRETPVPQSTVPGEQTAATQPVPVLPEAFSRRSLGPDDMFGLTRIDRQWCRNELSKLRNDGPYTPPDMKGSLIFPSALGGGNWGGSAYDPTTNLMIIKAENLATVLRITPTSPNDEDARGYLSRPLKGTGYRVDGDIFMSPLGIPCTPAPWGTLTAIDMSSGRIVWQVPLGQSYRYGILAPGFLNWGSPNVGGPLVTAGGLVFIGASLDSRFRAIDIRTGRELWQAPLPKPGMAVPASYAVGTRQFIVMAAGGSALAGTEVGDDVVAYALPAR